MGYGPTSRFGNPATVLPVNHRLWKFLPRIFQRAFPVLDNVGLSVLSRHGQTLNLNDFAWPGAAEHDKYSA